VSYVTAIRLDFQPPLGRLMTPPTGTGQLVLFFHYTLFLQSIPLKRMCVQSARRSVAGFLMHNWQRFSGIGQETSITDSLLALS